MALKLYDKRSNTILVETEYPYRFSSSDEEIKESIICLEHPIGKGFYKEVCFEGVHIGFGNAFLKDQILLDVESDFETVEMHFALKGRSTAMIETFGRNVAFDAHQHNIIYANRACGKMQWDSREFRICEINLSTGFFKKFLPRDTVIFGEFRNTLEKRQSGLLGRKHHRISHGMYRVIDEIMNCERQGIFKRMFLEAKIIELLLLQLEQFSEEPVHSTTLKKKDIDKIYAVREFILENLDASCSLIDLAHQVGTNDFILKKGFRELFGTTVFAFWNDVKMEQAKQMLTGQDVSIGEVAHISGYKNPRHFSAAFKRKFGVLPSQVKR